MKKHITSALCCICLMLSGYSQTLHFNWGYNIGKTKAVVYPTGSHVLPNGDLLMLLYVYPETGQPNDSVNINPKGTAHHVKNSSTVARYSSNGTLVWAFSFPHSASNNMVLNGVKAAPDGSFWLCGTFSGSMDANPDTGVYILTSKGYTDIFIGRYDGNGKLIKAFSLGSANTDVSESAMQTECDVQGNLYLFGNTVNDGVDFDPDSGLYRLWGFGSDATGNFMAKYSPQGDLVFVRPFSKNLICNRMSVSGRGDIVLLGRNRSLQAPLDMDPGSGEKLLTGRQVIAAYDSSGNITWGYGISSFELSMINTDKDGNIYTTGFLLNYQGSADIDFSSGTQILQSATGSSFIAVYNSNAVMQWHGEFGLAQNSYISGTNNAHLFFTAIHLSENHVYAQFSFKGAGVDVAPGAAQFTLSSERSDEYSTCVIRCNRINGTFDKAFHIGVQSHNQNLNNPYVVFDNASESHLYLITIFNATFNQHNPVDVNHDAQQSEWLTRKGNSDIILAQYAFDYIHTEVPDIEQQQVTVYPNPFTQSFTIEGLDDDMNIKLYNSMGQLVYEQKQVNGKTDVDVKPGVYFLYITQNATQLTFTKKLVRE